MNYPETPEGCPSVLSAAFCCCCLAAPEPCHPQTPSRGWRESEGAWQPAAVVSAARHRCQVRCLSSPTIQPLGRHQRRFCHGPKPAAGAIKNPTTAEESNRGRVVAGMKPGVSDCSCQRSLFPSAGVRIAMLLRVSRAVVKDSLTAQLSRIG